MALAFWLISLSTKISLCLCTAPPYAGRPLSYFYRHWYRPQQGMFCALPEDMDLGTFVAPPAPPVALGLLPDGRGFIKDGVSYSVGDCLFLQPGAFDDAEDDSSSEEESEEDEDEASSSEEDEGSSSEEEEEAEKQKAPAKQPAKGKRQQPARSGAKGKATVKSSDADMADGKDGSDEEDDSSGGDDSADEDFKARSKGSRHAAKPVAKKAVAAKKCDSSKQRKPSEKKRRSKGKSKDVQYADGRKGRFTKGSCEGLRAYVVARVVEVKASSSGKVGMLWLDSERGTASGRFVRGLQLHDGLGMY